MLPTVGQLVDDSMVKSRLTANGEDNAVECRAKGVWIAGGRASG